MGKSNNKSKGSSSSKTLTLAELWDEADAKKAGNNIPEGDHIARLNSLEEIKEGKERAIVGWVEIIEGDHEGKKSRFQYRLSTKSGEKAPGADVMKRDFERCGWKVSGDELKEKLEELTEEQPMLAITAKQNGNFTNIYINGLADGEGDDDGDGDDDDKKKKGKDFDIGDDVQFVNDEGDTVKGELKKLKSGKAHVEDSEGEVHKVDIDDLEEQEEDDDDDKKSKSKSKKSKDDDDDDDDDDDKKSSKSKKSKDDDDDDDDDDKKGDDDDAAEVEVGSKVKFTDDDGDPITGKVTKLKGDTATVEDDDDAVYKVDVADLTVVSDDDDDDDDDDDKKSSKKKSKDDDDDDDDGDTANFSVGDKVEFKDDDDDEITGKITKIKGETATVEDKKGNVYKVDLADLSEA